MNYVIANITDEQVKKGEKYPIVLMHDGMINIDVHGTMICFNVEDKDFIVCLNDSEKLWYVFESSADGFTDGADYALMELSDEELMVIQNFFLTIKKYHKNYSGNIQLATNSAIRDGFKTKEEAVQFIREYLDEKWKDIDE